MGSGRKAARGADRGPTGLHEAMLEGLCFPCFAVDAACRYLAYNGLHASSMLKRFGAEIRVGGNLLEYVAVEEDRRKAKGNIERALAGESVVAEEFSGMGENRTFLRISHRPLRDASGRVYAVLVTSQDFTADDPALRALKDSRERYRQLFGNMTTGFALHRMVYDGEGKPADYRFLEINPAFERLTGLAAARTVGRTVLEIMPGTEPFWIETYGRVVLTGEPVTFDSYARELGRHFEVRAFRPAEDEFAVLVTDITDRIRMEEGLRVSESRVRSKLDAILSPAGESAPLELADVIDVPAIQAVMDSFHALTRIGIAILDAHGAVLVTAGWQDICTRFHRVHPVTARRCTESDTRLTRDVPVGAHRLYRCGNGMWDMATPIEAGGRHLGDLFLGQFFFDDEEVDEEAFRLQARAHGFPEEEYIGALRRVPRWSRSTVESAMTFYGRFAGLLADLGYGNIRLARALEEQKRLLERLALATRAARAGIWDWDIVKDRLIWDDRMYELYGVRRGDFSGAYDAWLAGIHPADRAAADEASRLAQSGAREYDTEFRVVWPDGSVRTLKAYGQVVRDAGGTPLRMTGVNVDVTDATKAEETIRLNEARLESLLRIMQRPVAGIEEFLDFALEEAIALTGSRIGYIYRYDAERREFRLNSWSRGVMDVCAVAEKQTVYRLEETGLWGEAVRQGRPLIVNDFPAPNPLKKGFPAGHAPLETFLTVPVKSAGVIVAVIGVANRKGAYDESDVRQLELLMDSVWKAVERKGMEERTARLEEQLRQSQKMESIGRLAGGVAHDFNNLLAPILGYADLLLQGPSDRPGRRELEQIRKAGRMARDLTRQLLAFGRKQLLAMEVLDLRRVVSGFQGLLRRTIRESIALRLRTPDAPLLVRADAGQIEQVLMNLAVNAQDAMPDGGTLTMDLEARVLDAEYAAVHQGTKPGRYAMLTVSDTGHGMDEATRARLFEPFFTTKEKGKGTGLGLSTVYGIVKQHGGNIWVYSEPGHGTAFAVYLPMAEASAAEGTGPGAGKPLPEDAPPRGVEAILVVEDSETVRDLVRRMLEALGYRVLAAQDPESAEKALAADGGVRLVLSDVVMPGMDGQALWKRLEAARPGLRVLFMSGYTEDAVAHHGMLDGEIHFIQKPFTTSALARKVREVLDG